MIDNNNNKKPFSKGILCFLTMTAKEQGLQNLSTADEWARLPLFPVYNTFSLQLFAEQLATIL